MPALKRLGALAGAIAVGLFLAGTMIQGDRVGFDSSGAEYAAQLDSEQVRIQLGTALQALAVPFLIWFLNSVWSAAAAAGERAGRAARLALACGVVFSAVFLVDLTALATAALRPEHMLSNPELAATLRDFEFLAMGAAAFTVSGLLVALGRVALAGLPAWPHVLGWLALAAAGLYLLRAGTLFTTTGPFAADGALGLYVPVGALAIWTVAASLLLARGLPRGD